MLISYIKRYQSCRLTANHLSATNAVYEIACVQSLLSLKDARFSDPGKILDESGRGLLGVWH